jgi:hypothetical protein
MTHPVRNLLPALVALAFSLSAAPAQADWTCEGSALRGTVLGAATVEPLTANKAQPSCRAARAGLTGAAAALPLPLSAAALGAETTVGDQQVGALGGIADLRVLTLPQLPIQVPLPDLSAVPTVDVGVAQVDLKPIVQALLPDGRLPNVDVVRLQSLVAYASGRCVDGRVELAGSSQVAGLSVLGQELPVNQLVERTVTLADSETIDPSQANLADLDLPPGVTLTPLVQQTLQQALDAIPDIHVPAALATVKVVPGQQLRDGARLTQRALQVQVSVLGRPLADLVIGEASVGAEGVSCALPPAAPGGATQAALQCTTRRLVLADVIPGRRRVRLLGYADRRYVGRQVSIVFTGTGRRVARVRVRRDGSFSATAPMPARAIRGTNRARYYARIGRERSLRLKLMRRMQVLGVRTRGRQVTIAGRVVKPLAAPVRAIEVRRRISCSRWRVVRRIRPDRNGRFRVTLAGPPQQLAATYRLTTRVRASARGDSRKTFETFTLPRFVELG